MTVEARYNLFGLYNLDVQLGPGDTRALDQAPNLLARVGLRYDVTVIDEDTVNVTRTLNPFPAKASPYRREIKEEYVLTKEAINEGEIEGSRILGVKDSIIWVPRKK